MGRVQLSTARPHPLLSIPGFASRCVKVWVAKLFLRVLLMEEAAEETEHKGWCDTELATNENTRREKTEAVETLHAEIYVSNHGRFFRRKVVFFYNK